MKLNKLLTGICLLTAFAACDNYLDITPKGEAVLNTTDDYLGLLEEEMPTYTGSEFGYLANVVTYYDRSQLDGYSFPLISSSYFWDESVDRAQYMDDDAGESQLYNNCYARISRYNIIIDKLFEGDMLDISADIDVMERMLQRDGLSNDLKMPKADAGDAPYSPRLTLDPDAPGGTAAAGH